MLKNNLKFRAIILAGGKGTRLKNITKQIPKPLIKIKNNEFIFYLINYFIKNKVEEIVITTHYKSFLFIKYFKNNKFKNIKIIKEKKPLGTGGSFLNAMRIIKNKKNVINILCNADTLLLFPIKFHLNKIKDKDYNLLVVKKKNCQKYGKVNTKSGNLTGINRNIKKSGYISSGYFFFKNFKQSFIKTKSKNLNFEKDIIGQMIKKKIDINVIKLNAPFIDIGTPDDLKKADRFIQKNYNEFIKKL